MSQAIIKTEHVSKKFLISHEGPQRYHSLRDVIAQKARALVGRRSKNVSKEEFYALRDLTFEVEPGDRLGIIGRNGAGKSTLLKILSRITEPTEGRIRIRGRVASLLEVGTGFHPELTGRENIFLNGAILGMSRAEIRQKFDEIVAFAEVERFLDTPVKRFSSGMYVRLAFAVAAHLEPEILVIDEVLAVGDAQFQKKCLGKMEDVSRQEGRTVLFVSHNLGVISQLCNRALLLEGGRLVMEGQTNAVVDRYVNQFNEQSTAIQKDGADDKNQFLLAYMSDPGNNRRVEYRFDEEVIVAVELLLNSYSDDLELAVRLVDRYNNPVFTILEKLDKHYKRNGKRMRLNVVFPAIFITPGKYSWVLCINEPGVQLHDLQNDVLPFRVLDTGSDFSRYDGINYGSVFAQYSVQDLTPRNS